MFRLAFSLFKVTYAEKSNEENSPKSCQIHPGNVFILRRASQRSSTLSLD